MSADFYPIADNQATCKCCGTPSPLFGVVDFHKNCEIQRRRVLNVSGIPVYYWRCPECKFIFTTVFDHFTQEDFQRYIYNAEYVLVDPEYRELRPKGNAEFIKRLFPNLKPRRLLDYGSGEGLTAELLRRTGNFEADCYDPFVPRFATRPLHQYDCIISFEVLEHTPDPLKTIIDMNSFLANDGLIVFSTLIQPADIDQQGLNWWYAGPRNGHVSLYTRASLFKLAQRVGLKHGHFNDGLHVFFRNVPTFAQHFIRVS